MRTNDPEEYAVFTFRVKKHRKHVLQFGTVPVSRITWCHIPLGDTSKFKSNSGAVYRVMIFSCAYIYIYIYVCVCVCVCVFGIQQEEDLKNKRPT